MVDLLKMLKELHEPVLYETGGNHEFITENIFELTGYYAAEIIMKRDLFPGLINPEDYIETNFKIKNWHKQNEAGILTLQFRIQSANGSQVWIEDHLIGSFQNDKKFMQDLMMNIDSSKNKETELLQLRTFWREKEMEDEKERESVFKDIQRQLDDIDEEAKKRKEKVTIILSHVKEKLLSFKEAKYY